MRYLVLLRGISGSGKSTFIKDNKLDVFTLSSDKYRLMLSSPIPKYNKELEYEIPQTYNSVVWKRLYEDLEFRMQHGEFTIIDATHLTKQSIQKYKKLCSLYFYRLIIVNFDVDINTCIENDKKRYYAKVGEDVIRKQYEKKEELSKSILQITPDALLPLLASKYQLLDFNKYKAIHIIGDIHGCYTPLAEFMQNYKDTDAYIFVGDYFDRGIENYKVFKFIYDRLDKDNFYFLWGNHEKRIVDYLRGEDVSHTQFGKNTLVQLQQNGITDKMLTKLCRSLITCAYFFYNHQPYLVSHAGLPTDIIHVGLSDDVFVKGVGTYEDMNIVCETFNNMACTVQIFGHRNNLDVPIKINDKCYNVCGFPEVGGDLKAVTIDSRGIQEHYISNKVFSKELYYQALVKYPNRFTIDNVKTLIGAFRHNRYVNENKFGNISSFAFSKEAFYDDIWNNISTRARGIFINTKTEEIVARSYNKFFLMNQYEHCTLDKFIPPFRVYKKYDGFLGILGYDSESDSIIYCSKSTIAPYGEYANLFKNKIEPLIKDKQGLKEFLKTQNVSMVFECIATKEDEHLIKYPNDMIILLDIISRTIDYEKPYDYDNYEYYTNKFFNKVLVKKFVEQYQIIFDQIDALKAVPNIEGYVIEDANERMFKLKTYEYETLKIARNIEDNYKTIKQKAGDHIIKYPPKESIEKRYSPYYAPCVVNKLYDITKNIIDKLNF